MTQISKTVHSPSRALDHRIEDMMGRLLQAGVVLASSVVLIGGLFYLRAHSGTTKNYRTFTSEPASLRHPVELFRLLMTGDAAAIIQLGVLLLIATPIARVVFAAIGFAVERDRLFVAISLVVLAVLIFGLVHVA
ncbi:MAG TPA: DUF1634 domain-containing protein [Edaphobacter sp.]|nr:DUF1634 domain-containing protein [Edaphobacter sp.]